MMKVFLSSSAATTSLLFGGMIPICLGSSYLRRAKDKNTGCAPRDAPPNADQVTYGYNVLLGIPPSEQREKTLGSKLFHLTGDVGGTMEYTMFEQFEDMSISPGCANSEQVQEVWYSTSSSSLKSQGKSSSSGIDMKVEVGVKAGKGNATVSAETTIRNALVFGNSKSSANAMSQKEAGYSHSFDAKSHRSLYTVEVGHKKGQVDTWTEDFKMACSDLGDSPTREQVLKFFDDYGTHGLNKATFGQSCTASLFMEAGQTQSSYYSIFSEESSYEAGLLWWKKSGNSQEQDEQGQISENGFRYTLSDRRCEGELVLDSSCGGDFMKGSGGDIDRPAIIDWEFLPIWEMDVGQLSDGAKDALKKVVEDVLEASVSCAETNCNGRGACAADLKVWDNIGPSLDLGDMFDGSKCFCEDEFQGSSCETGSSLQVENPGSPGSYLNNIRGDMNFDSDSPICGMKSQFDSSKNDRRFQLYTCDITEPGFGTATGTQSIRIDNHAIANKWTMDCGTDMVLTGLSSEFRDIRNGGLDDRVWSATCSKYENVGVRNCDSYESKGFANDYLKPLDNTCPVGKVITGIHSTHNSVHNDEDRQYKFRCCELHFAAGNLAQAPAPYSPYCSRGLYHESTRTCFGLCGADEPGLCPKSGYCGGSGCSSRPGGSSQCCRGVIGLNDRECSSPEDTGCFVPAG